MDTSVGKRIKLVRGDCTQADFAQQLGVHKNSLSRYERDSSKPDTDFMQALCTKYGVSASWLVLGQGTMYEGETKANDPDPMGDGGEWNRGQRDIFQKILVMSESVVSLAQDNQKLTQENGELKVENIKLLGELDTARKMAKEYYEELKAREGPPSKNLEEPRKVG